MTLGVYVPGLDLVECPGEHSCQFVCFQYRVTFTFFPVFYTISCLLFVVVVAAIVPFVAAAAAIIVLTVFRLDAKNIAVVMPLSPTCHL